MKERPAERLVTEAEKVFRSALHSPQQPTGVLDVICCELLDLLGPTNKIVGEVNLAVRIYCKHEFKSVQ